jgi:SAM-dependent methyltransferase
LLPDIPAELIGAAPGSWPEALSQRPRKKRLRPWFEEVFDEDYLRTLPFMTAEQTLREVAFIREALAPPPDGQILDIACGYGRHAIELSQRGLRVTGLDLSLPLLIRAADESQRRSLSVNFVHADMREMAFDGQFDGAYCILSSFGYFDEETNLKVATAICRSLKPGGRFLLDTLNRDYIVSDLPTRVWWEGDGCVVLEEVDFNFHTSRVIIRRSVVFQDGRQVEQDISIRAYSLHELGKLLRQAGFRVLDVSGSLATKGNFFGATSRNIIMVCERPNG